MCRVDVKEAATIGAQVFNDLHRSHGTLSDGLYLPIQGMYYCVGVEVLNHALRDEDQRTYETDRQQDIERAAYEINPEVAQVLRAAAGQSAHQGHSQRDARGSRDELVKGQAGHLGQVAHGLFARIVLPVSIGGETGGGIEGQLLLPHLADQPG